MLQPSCSNVLPALLQWDLSQKATRMVDTEENRLYSIITTWLSASITRSWKLRLGLRTKAPVISYFPEKVLRTPGTGAGLGAICHFYILFLLFLLNRTANKGLDIWVPGLIRSKLIIPLNFLLCGKMLASLLQNFPSFSCVESPLYAVVQENPGSQESCFLWFSSLVHREVSRYLIDLSPPFHSKKSPHLESLFRKSFPLPQLSSSSVFVPVLVWIQRYF